MTPTAPPAATESEQRVIGALLRDPELIPSISGRLTEKDFINPYHGAAFGALMRMHQEGIPSDEVTTKTAFNQTGEFNERYPAAVYIMETWESVIGGANLDHHASEVMESSQKRRIASMAMDAQKAAMNGKGSSEILAFIGNGLAELQKDTRDPEQSSGTILDDLAGRILSREKPGQIQAGVPGTELGKFPISKGHVALIGAPPAEGKTAIVMQMVFDALRIEGQANLRVLVANVEMNPDALLTRQLARLSGVGLSYLIHRDYDESATHRIEGAAEELRALMPQIEFMRPPFTLERLAQQSEAAAADIVVVDYVQRFRPADPGTDMRLQTNASMETCRRIADRDAAVFAISAMSRQRGSHGSTYDTNTMGLASFRESSELEYGADTAWVLSRDDDAAKLRSVKNRHGAMTELVLKFDGQRQEFTDDLRAYEWRA